MKIKLTFLGAAHNVTGSQYLVEVNNIKFLVDCGLHQERDYKDRNWLPFAFPINTLDAVLITHAHLDHCGLLPKLVREGFQRPIYCTEATSEISEIMLLDSGKLQEEDAEFKRKRHEREGRRGPHPEIPLYTMDDAKAVVPFFTPVRYGEATKVGEGVEATFYDAGHVLGSATIKLRISYNGDERTLLFSGDIGPPDKPIICDPTMFEEADYVLIESTYGSRVLESADDSSNKLADIINETVRAGGNIVIPSFALERAQEILFYLNKLMIAKRIPHLTVFVDSPMAVNVIAVFERHPELFDTEMSKLMKRDRSPFDFPGLKLVHTVEESKMINQAEGSSIIIAGSGMCTGGRIKHHLVTNISRPHSTILFAGYQAIGTLGRQIVDGAEEVRILGQHYPVKARIVQLSGFSAHADRNRLLNWVSNIKNSPNHIFVTHGEPEASSHLAGLIRDKTRWDTVIPNYKDKYVLD